MILLLRNAITREFFVLCCIGTSILSSLPTKQYNFHCHVHNISRRKVSTGYRNQLSRVHNIVTSTILSRPQYIPAESLNRLPKPAISGLSLDIFNTIFACLGNSSISHDIFNPISACLGNLSRLSADPNSYFIFYTFII